MNRRTFSKMALASAGVMAHQSLATVVQDTTWRPVPGPLTTKWSAEVSPSKAWPEYPRPGMRRDLWENLNGLWEYAVTPLDATAPAGTQAYSNTILVPFGMESSLSGVMKPLSPSERLWYRRTFDIPSPWSRQRVLLHFDAVDYECSVWLNGQPLGQHSGGYDRFGFDITHALRAIGPQELVVSVVDPTNEGEQAHGKQTLRPRGASYTATSGIWQTVWTEPTPHTYIESLRLRPDVASSRLRIGAEIKGQEPHGRVKAIVTVGEHVVAQAEGGAGSELTLTIDKPRLWSPDDPFLYDLKVSLIGSSSHTEDTVASYFGMREVGLGKDEQGRCRLFLNGKAVFHQGPLDQGFWPDGIYTAPTDDALKFDLEYMKSVGFNAVRKHVKIEPERWYYWADKLGLLVWQDMPAGQLRTPESRIQWEAEMVRHVKNHFNHPSVVMWTLFNEGWGQYDTAQLVSRLRALDDTRLINNASGWYDRPYGDIVDMHFYPGPSACALEEKRASVTGEFGGLGFVTTNHMWKDGAWGYQTFTDAREYQRTYERLWQRVHTLRDRHGLSAAIYTQITDVETESNGILTYDRKVEKIDRHLARAAHLGDLSPIVYKPALPMASEQPQEWKYINAKPPDNWMQPTFDDARWLKGEGGFGTRYGAPEFVKTRWNTTDLWIRREFTAPPEGFRHLVLTSCYGVDFEVYINGELACRPEGFHNAFGIYELSPPACAGIKPGSNSIGVHLSQKLKGGEQYFDLGLADEITGERE